MKRLLCLALSLLVGILALGAQEVHTVSRGETLFGIARDVKVPVETLKSWNGLKDNVIFIGQKLKLYNNVQNLQASTPSLGETPSTSPAPTQTPTPAPSVSASAKTYTVKSGDSLGLVAQNHKLSVNELRAWNNLFSTNLSPNQVLLVSEPEYLSVYTVKAGDTLYSIARENPLSFSDLLALNGMGEATTLKVGQRLTIAKPKDNQGWHYVKRGDSLETLASLYGVSLSSIRSLNNLQGNASEGSLIKIRETDPAKADLVQEEVVVTSPEPAKKEEVASPKKVKTSTKATHTVEAGDTLYSIARRYSILIDELKSINSLQGNSIYKGMVLNLPQKVEGASVVEDSAEDSVKPSPPTGGSLPSAPSAGTLPSRAEVESNKPLKSNPPSVSSSELSRLGSLKSLVVLDPKIPLYEWNKDYYYWKHPELMRQPSSMYFEQWNSPLDAYRKATQLINAFDKLVEARPKISNKLKGKTIILDPGHGGLDPGAIVKSKDGMGRDIYITEDEYVYDIALRMYVLLKDHGANVKLTILAPDHLIRDTSPASNTLVNMKNEVYNLESLNIKDTKDSWPNGSQDGLAKRMEVVKSMTQRSAGESTIFVSLHADNQPAMPRHTGILYQKNAEMNDGYSQQMAETMQGAMNKDRVYIKGQDLFVLRNNPLKYKVLVELRNVSSVEEAWALRFADMRQDDAEKVVKGILAFFNS